MSKQKQKLKKSRSHDVTSIGPIAESPTNSTGGCPKGSLLRREEFICSDGHNAHLEEDYMKDESKLFGRPIGSPSSSRSLGRRTLKTVASESSIRRFFKSKSVDAHSLKSSSSPTVSPRDHEGVRSSAAVRTIVENVDPTIETRNLGDESSENDETADGRSRLHPRKPPRKRELGSLTGNGVDRAALRTCRSPSIDPQTDSIVCNATDYVVRNGSLASATDEHGCLEEDTNPYNLSKDADRRDSVVRPLHCDVPCGFVRPRLYSRHSLTHDRQFSLENEEIEQPKSNGDITFPERPRRSRNSSSNLVKRESLIHPQRPPRRRAPLGTTNLYQPLIVNGRFQSPWSTWKRPSFFGSLRWSLFSKDNSSVPNSVEELDKTLPVLPLCPESISHPPTDGMRVTWLGHSTVLVQFSEISVLTDPMFGERASPVGFMGPKRIRSFPGSVYDLPKLDAVVISHNHYDHLDHNSVLLLNARFGSELHWFVPVGLRTWMHNAGCESVTELTWWAEGSLRQASEIAFMFTPAQHWSKRSLTDDNKVLWGSWCIMGPRYRFFFAGDTGYCDAFKQIGDQFGPFDLAAIPIGSYEPRWFMHTQHIDPTEAVKIHQDIKSLKSFGIHWGTFVLSNEHYLEPPKKLIESARQVGLSRDDFFVLKHGESKLVYGT